MKISRVLTNKRHEHTKEPLVVFHRSTEFVRNSKGKITRVNSHTYMKPETVELRAQFIRENFQ